MGGNNAQQSPVAFRCVSHPSRRASRERLAGNAGDAIGLEESPISPSEPPEPPRHRRRPPSGFEWAEVRSFGGPSAYMLLVRGEKEMGGQSIGPIRVKDLVVTEQNRNEREPGILTAIYLASGQSSSLFRRKFSQGWRCVWERISSVFQKANSRRFGKRAIIARKESGV